MGGQNGFIIHHYNRQYQIYPDFNYFLCPYYESANKTMTDNNNEMNAGNGTPCCHCHGEVPLPGKTGNVNPLPRARNPLPRVTCIDVEPDDFNDWD